MSEDVVILFCDNDERRHRTFREEVELPLRREYGISITVLHSQSLEATYEEDYTDHCKELGAKSVETYLDAGQLFDLVITDMDFGSQPTLGTVNTGMRIIREVDKRIRPRCPWIQYVLITAQAHRLDDRGEFVDIAEFLRSRDSFIEFDDRQLERGWEKVQTRAIRLVERILGERPRFQQALSGVAAPELYEVIIFRKDLVDSPMHVVVKEKEAGGNALSFRLGAQGVTFAALAQHEGRFITLGNLARAASKRKASTVGEEFVRLDLQQQRRLLLAARIQWGEGTEFCDLADPQDLCGVANGRMVSVGQVGYQCQEKLTSTCVKKLYSQEIASDETKVTEDNVRNHVKEIRANVNDAHVALRTSPRSRRMPIDHEGPHVEAEFCGDCLIYRRRGKAGYALAASVKWVDCDDDKDVERRIQACLSAH